MGDTRSGTCTTLRWWIAPGVAPTALAQENVHIDYWLGTPSGGVAASTVASTIIEE